MDIQKSIQEKIAERKLNILKGFSEADSFFEKARGGVYKDNAQNQKMARVGQKYGADGKPIEEGNDEKSKEDENPTDKGVSDWAKETGDKELLQYLEKNGRDGEHSDEAAKELTERGIDFNKTTVPNYNPKEKEGGPGEIERENTDLNDPEKNKKYFESNDGSKNPETEPYQTPGGETLDTYYAMDEATQRKVLEASMMHNIPLGAAVAMVSESSGLNANIQEKVGNLENALNELKGEFGEDDEDKIPFGDEDDEATLKDEIGIDIGEEYSDTVITDIYSNKNGDITVEFKDENGVTQSLDLERYQNMYVGDEEDDNGYATHDGSFDGDDSDYDDVEDDDSWVPPHSSDKEGEDDESDSQQLESAFKNIDEYLANFKGDPQGEEQYEDLLDDISVAIKQGNLSKEQFDNIASQYKGLDLIYDDYTDADDDESEKAVGRSLGAKNQK